MLQPKGTGVNAHLINTLLYTMADYYNNQNENQRNIRDSILKSSYFAKGEDSIFDVFERVCNAFSSNKEHSERLYGYLSLGWFLPSTPILANAGSDKNMPISCFLNEPEDTLEDIISTRVESEYLTSYGGGIGTNFSKIREVGSKIKDKGKSAGIIPVMKSNYTCVDAVMQAGARRGALAGYLHISHPELEEFLYIRTKGGDNKRKVVSMDSAHHAVVLNEEFKTAIREDADWYFTSPLDGKKIKCKLTAQQLWQSILTTRIEHGEPYILFEDNVNRSLPNTYKDLGLKVNMSNLCSEIVLTTGKDHLGNKRTAVCCLSSLNLYTYDDWKDNGLFIKDVLEFLDNVLQHFIDNAPDTISCAKYSAMRERSIGLGVMGFHSYLQKKLIDIESIKAADVNRDIFRNIFNKSRKANFELGAERGSNEDFKEYAKMNNLDLIHRRFTHMLAIAPTATISKIAGVSYGIEPYYAVTYLDKAKEGRNTVLTKSFDDLLDSKNLSNKEEVINECIKANGNLAKVNLKLGQVFTNDELRVFKPWIDIDQNKLVNLTAERQQYICQSQSFNIMLPPDIEKRKLNAIHWNAWKLGVKSMYYCRSQSLGNYGNNAEECEVCQ